MLEVVVIFGKSISKYCPNCDKDAHKVISIGFAIEKMIYTEVFSCPNCNLDLAEQDREKIKDCKEKGIEVLKILY